MKILNGDAWTTIQTRELNYLRTRITELEAERAEAIHVGGIDAELLGAKHLELLASETERAVIKKELEDLKREKGII